MEHFDHDIKVVFHRDRNIYWNYRETGTIIIKKLNQDGMELSIRAKKVLKDLKVNDSISCSGFA